MARIPSVTREDIPESLKKVFDEVASLLTAPQGSD